MMCPSVSFQRLVFIGAVLFLCVLGRPADSAEDREAELFDKGYEYLFSFKPEQAAETFRTFLREFPQSSVKDAAMFWLGKTLVHLRNFDEAGRIFAAIRKDFPESLFLTHIAAEEAEIARLKMQPPPSAKSTVPEPPPEQKSPPARDSQTAPAQPAGADNAVVSGLQAEISRLKAREQNLNQEISGLNDQLARNAETGQAARAETDHFKAEANRLNVELASLRTELESLKTPAKTEKPKPAEPVSQESPRIRELDQKTQTLEKDLLSSRAETAKLASLIDAEKKRSAAQEAEAGKLREELAKARTAAEHRPDSAETDSLKTRIESLGQEKSDLQARIEDLEQRLSIREQDMKILNSYLSHLMFSRKDEAAATPAEDRKQAASAPPEPAAATHTKEPLLNAQGSLVTLTQAVSEMLASATALQKMGVSALPWRTGSAYEDFMSERLLALEASRVQISHDVKKTKQLSDRYRLTADEASYLRTLLAISGLVNSRTRNVEKARSIDVLNVQYTQKTISERALIAAELQKQARGGKAFEEIQKDFPGHVKFSRLSPEEFQRRFREKSRVLEKLDVMKEDTVVLWTENGYSIIRPVTTRLSFDPFAQGDAADQGMIRQIVTDLIAELKKSKT